MLIPDMPQPRCLQLIERAPIDPLEVRGLEDDRLLCPLRVRRGLDEFLELLHAILIHQVVEEGRPLDVERLPPSDAAFAGSFVLARIDLRQIVVLVEREVSRILDVRPDGRVQRRVPQPCVEVRTGGPGRQSLVERAWNPFEPMHDHDVAHLVSEHAEDLLLGRPVVGEDDDAGRTGRRQPPRGAGHVGRRPEGDPDTYSFLRQRSETGGHLVQDPLRALRQVGNSRGELARRGVDGEVLRLGDLLLLRHIFGIEVQRLSTVPLAQHPVGH
jgi:hypothetical protein